MPATEGHLANASHRRPRPARAQRIAQVLDRHLPDVSKILRELDQTPPKEAASTAQGIRDLNAGKL